MVYTTSTGRNMLRGKIVAAVTAGMALYLLLTGLTLGIYFAQWDYSGLYASVSSQFNFLDRYDGASPPFSPGLGLYPWPNIS